MVGIIGPMDLLLCGMKLNGYGGYVDIGIGIMVHVIIVRRLLLVIGVYMVGGLNELGD
jgi:hypothetical protein